MFKTIAIEHRHPRPNEYLSTDCAWYCTKDSSVWVHFKGSWQMLKENVISITDKDVIKEINKQIEELYSNES